MTIEEFFKETYPSSLDSYGFDCFRRPRITCKDGFSMSVQANAGAYCAPRRMCFNGYRSAEIGFPSKSEDLIMEFAESPETPTETVYGWVPVETINAVLEKHGGIDREKTFNE